MTKQEKIASLDKAMTASTRDSGETFNHFTEEAPGELQSLFLENYEVRDQDYEIFAIACGVIGDVYASEKDATYDEIQDAIGEEARESASIWTENRLGYLTMHNQDEVADIAREHECDIAEACAVWYDREVEKASFLINDWVNATN